MEKKELIIIGGGPAGLAAAIAAKKEGINDLLIVERDDRLGGILNQCIHNGFGLHTFKEELTGPEYAKRFEDMAEEENVPYVLNTMVLDVSLKDDMTDCGAESADIEQTAGDGVKKTVTLLSRDKGLVTYETDAVILAMGCRERPRGALNTPGYRPAGIYTAGTAQRLVNIEGVMPGREVVILGSGDIGLIMARRMTLEGAKVKLVAELMPYSGGLKRNIVQCLDDFGIPLKLSHTVVDIKGKERVEAVTIAQVDENKKPIPGTEEEIKCDTLLLSCGLLPENELSRNLGVELSPVTGGPVVDNTLATSIEGVFACGNVLHVHDLVDYVSEEAKNAGYSAAKYIKSIKNGTEKQDSKYISVKTEGGIRYSVPAKINPDTLSEKQILRFRVGSVIKKCTVELLINGKVAARKKRPVVSPGEMEEFLLMKKYFETAGEISEIVLRIIPDEV